MIPRLSHGTIMPWVIMCNQCYSRHISQSDCSIHTKSKFVLDIWIWYIWNWPLTIILIDSTFVSEYSAKMLSNFELLPKFWKSNEVSFSNKQESLKVLSHIYISSIPALHVCSQAVLTRIVWRYQRDNHNL